MDTFKGFVNEAFDGAVASGCQTEVKHKISIAWKNIQFQVNEFGGLTFKKKVILNRLSGHFETGSLNALLGPSGAGKTTLLNCLSGNQKSGLSDNSQIYINSQSESTISYFISQHVHENIVGELTVGQILNYAFKFKNGVGHSSEAIERYIQETLTDLLLDKSILVQQFAMCSGGEQKRVAIAQELMALTAPSFLFLDEPTTGLDSAAAFEVISCLARLANRYRITVIASIHAPNHETLHLFDQLYVLAKGGVCIFSGPPKQIKPYIESELQVTISFEQPPIEALIKIACDGIQSFDVIKLANKTNASQSAALLIHHRQLSLLQHGFPNPRKSFHLSDYLLQCSRLFRITFIARRRAFLLSILLFTIYFTLLSTMFSPSMTSASGCIPYSTAESNQSSTCASNLEEENLIKENANFLANVLIYTGVVTICTSTAVFASVIKVFRNEHRNHWYSLGVFYWSSLLISFLELAIYAVLNASLGYFLPSQHAIDNYAINWNRFGHYIFFMWLLCFYMQSIGQLVGVILVDHVELAIVICLIYHTGASMINGFFVDTERTGNVFLTEGSSLVAFKYISWCILYTFYGVDRCDWKKEFSMVVQFFHIDLDSVHVYVMRVLLNILVVRLFTLLIMFGKFNSLENDSLVRMIKTKYLDNSIGLPNQTHAYLDLKANLNNSKQHISKITTINADNCKMQTEIIHNKIIIAWRSLSLFAEDSFVEVGLTNTKQTPILRNLNGQFRLNSLNALMGTSGAGKTSLLKVLNGRCKTRLSDETEIYLSKFTAIHTCFITQDVSGHLMPGLTAKQLLMYASRLKNAGKDVDYEQIALKWLNELDLVDAVNTKVDRCSGGERKRLAVALELTALEMPNLICIDEPTSGLDTNSAEIVISTLRQLTRSHPIAIITSIHQPTSGILNQFDQLYVLARGGVCIYSGAPDQTQAHLKAIPGISSSPCQFPIEELIKHSCANHQNPIVQQLIQQSNNQWLKSDSQLSYQTQLTLDGIQRNRVRFSLHSVCILFLRYFTYFHQHLWKEHLFYCLNYLFYGIAIPLFYDHSMVDLSGCIDIQNDFNNNCSRNAETVEQTYQLINNFKYNYFVTNFFMIFLMIQLSLSFLKELKLFENENRNGWYSSGSFYLTKSIFELLPLLPTIFLYVYICNWYEDIVPGIYWNFLYIFLLSTIAFQGMSHMLALLSRGNMSLLIIQSVTLFLFFVLLSNFLLLHSRLHYIYQFISNFAISRHLFESFILAQYGFGRCKENEIQATLYSMGLKNDDYYRCIWLLIFNIAFYRIIAFYLLLCKANSVENRKQRVTRIDTFCNDLKPVHFQMPGFGSIVEMKIQLTQF